MKKYIIHDTLEAFIKEGDNLHFFGLTTNANINQSVNQEKLQAGIGHKTFAMVQSNKEMDFSITTGLHYNDIYEIQSGTEFKEGTVTVLDVKIDENGGITAEDKEVTGDVIDFNANTFPKNHYVQLHTIAYEVETNKIVADVYYIFKKALPDGALNETFENKNKTSEVKFTALVDEKGNYGQCIIVSNKNAVKLDDTSPKSE